MILLEYFYEYLLFAFCGHLNYGSGHVILGYIKPNGEDESHEYKILYFLRLHLKAKRSLLETLIIKTL